jgi:hypothetical protein
MRRTSGGSINQRDVKLFKLLSEPPDPKLEAQLRELLKKIPLNSLYSMNNTTGYSVLHVACSNYKGYYGQLVLDIA